MSNYPMGSSSDPNAPWNKGEDRLCMYCDRNELEVIATNKAILMAKEANSTITNEDDYKSDNDFFDICLQEEIDNCNSCRVCYLEDHADDWEDDI